jgi:hypothetical protein
MWDKSGAEIAALDDPDPLDRWTRHVIEPIASSVDGLALFPFAGPPLLAVPALGGAGGGRAPIADRNPDPSGIRPVARLSRGYPIA